MHPHVSPWCHRCPHYMWHCPCVPKVMTPIPMCPCGVTLTCPHVPLCPCVPCTKHVPTAGQWRGDPATWRCCRDGATALPVRATCDQRGQRVTTAGGCRDAFLHCCALARDLRRRGQAGGLARGEHGWWCMGTSQIWGPHGWQDVGTSWMQGPCRWQCLRTWVSLGPAVLEAALEQQLLDDEEVPTRSFFPESWLWRRVPVDGSVRCDCRVTPCPLSPMSLCPRVPVSHISVSPGSQCCSQTPSPPGRFRLLPSSPVWVSVTTCLGGPMWLLPPW